MTLKLFCVSLWLEVLNSPKHVKMDIIDGHDSFHLGIGAGATPIYGDEPNPEDLSKSIRSGIGAIFSRKFTPKGQSHHLWLRRWFKTPHPAFQGRTPDDLVESGEGAEVVLFMQRATR